MAADARSRVCPKLTRGSPLFYPIPTYSACINSRLVRAYRFCFEFLYVLNYRYGANCLGFCIKWCKYLGFFSAPFVSGCTATALRKKETVKLNMVNTLERATITMLVRERHLQLQ